MERVRAPRNNKCPECGAEIEWSAEYLGTEGWVQRGTCLCADQYEEEPEENWQAMREYRGARRRYYRMALA